MNYKFIPTNKINFEVWFVPQIKNEDLDSFQEGD